MHTQYDFVFQLKHVLKSSFCQLYKNWTSGRLQRRTPCQGEKASERSKVKDAELSFHLFIAFQAIDGDDPQVVGDKGQPAGWWRFLYCSQFYLLRACVLRLGLAKRKTCFAARHQWPAKCRRLSEDESWGVWEHKLWRVVGWTSWRRVNLSWVISLIGER